MFTQPKKSPEDTTLELLADAYKCYNNAQWDYTRSDAGTGGLLVDRCIAEPDQLKNVVSIIGKGLLEGKKNATPASLMFGKLYKDGFKDGLYKDDIQNGLKEILPLKSIEKLNAGDTTMEDCLRSLCIYAHIMSF